MSEKELKKIELDPEVKDELLKLAENVSKESVDSAFKIAEIMIKKSTNVMDDLLLPALPFIKGKILELIENIHQEG